MRTACASCALLLFSAAAVASDRHPDSLGKRDIDWGYEWIAASRVLTSDGTLKSAGVHERLRRGLDWQIRNSVEAPDLKAGQTPSAEHCAPPPPWAAWAAYPPDAEQDGRFMSALLLSDVAVTGTVAEAIPGFYGQGNPAVLLALSDVTPLHGRAVSIGYVLIPVKRMVTHGHVFCDVMGSNWGATRSPHVDVDDRVVVIGSWSPDNVVRSRTRNRLGVMAQIHENGRLEWLDSLGGAPGSLEALQSRADEALVGGLFEMTAHLTPQDYGSDERREFVKQWSSYESGGCRVVEVAHRPETGWVPVRKICGPKPER